MTLDEHAKHLGELVANFQSLEFILRAFLQALPTAPPFGLPHGTDVYTSPVGAEVPKNEFTNYDQLGELIRKVNLELERRGSPTIDPTLVDVRDALAHGRVSTAVPDAEDMRLLKFSRPQNGKVRIEFNEVISAAWFKEQKRRTHEAIVVINSHLATADK